MTAKCKPCPFCGSSRVEVWESWHPNFTIECAKCEAAGPASASEADAIEWWNEAPRLRSNSDLTQVRARRMAQLKTAHDKASRQRIAKEKAELAAIVNAERERSTWAAEREAWLRAPITRQARRSDG